MNGSNLEASKESRNVDRETPSGTVTFLFTDIEGSTRLLEGLREQYATLLDDQRQILRAAFKRWNGTEIDTQGDSFFAVFPRAIDAVCCVMEAQRELNAHKWPQDATVRVRMGLHTGEPIQMRTGYVGMDVHRAARIAAAGHGGQVLLSQTTRDLVVQDLPKGVSLRDLGQHKLKDIRFQQQIYQLEIEGLAAEFPPLRSLSMDQEPPTPGEAPFKGMQHFDETDAEWFFGREQVSQKLIQLVQEQRFLAVIGASGSGKSSILRAGLVPGIKRIASGKWQVHILTPSNHPLESLAVSLSKAEPSVTATATLIDDLRRDTRTLHLYIRRSIPQGSQIQVLLVIDQFEELFTQCRDETERLAFVDNLLYAAGTESGPTRIVIALRADFYQFLAQYTGLRIEVAKHQEYLGAMEAAELRQAIEEPARRGGWEFSPGLVELMLHDIGAIEGHQPEPGALPLLSHALLETWKRRRGNLMSLRAYSEAGGVRGAIAKTADSVFYGMLTPEQQRVARNIFLRLTELGEGTQDTRRCVSIHELIPPARTPANELIRDVLVKLADARLIITSQDTVEVAHEALIREWPLLREWLAQDREGLRLHRLITESAQEWERLERDEGALYRGARLAQALEWAQANPDQPNTLEHAFLNASQEASQREILQREEQNRRELEAARKLAETQAMAARRLRRRAWYLLGALVMAALLAVAAVFFGQQSNQNAQIAGQNLATAQSESQRAEGEALRRATQQSIAETEANTRATAEANALEQADLASSRELAAAAINNLRVDPERSILLALEALKKADTLEAENALHQAILATRLIATLPAGSQSIFGIAVSPDGSKFASSGMDGELKIWDFHDLSALSDEAPLLTLSNPIDYDVSTWTVGSTLAFSPDGSRLAVIAEKQSAKIWDAQSGLLLQTLSDHTGNVWSVAFDPSGKRLVTTCADGTIHLWDVLTGQKLLTLTIPENGGDTAGVYSAAFTPDGKQLITGSDDAIARFWDLDANPGKELFSLSFDYDTEGPPDLFAFSPEGKYLAIGVAAIAKVWDYEELQLNPSAKPLFTLFGHQNNINSLTFTSDGSRLVTGSSDGTAKVWDASTGQESFTLVGGLGSINSLVISPDGIHPLSAHSDGRIRVWDISPTGSREGWAVYPTNRGRFSADGKQLATMYWVSDLMGKLKFQLWDLASFGAKEIHNSTVDLGIRRSTYDINGDLSRIATVDVNMTLKVWESATGQLLHSFPISETTQSAGHTDYVFGIAFNPDSTRIATGGDDGKAIVWDLSSGKALLTLIGHTGPVRGLAFSPDGTRLATGSFDGTARIWDARTGETLQTLSGHEGAVINVIFSSEGKRLLTGSDDTTAKVWDIQTGKELLTLKGHNSTVFWEDFSPDGMRIATGSLDGSVKVWDSSSGQNLLTLPGFYVRFAPDGKSLLAISIEDGVGRGFYLDVQELSALARMRVTRQLTEAECQQYLHMTQCPVQ